MEKKSFDIWSIWRCSSMKWFFIVEDIRNNKISKFALYLLNKEYIQTVNKGSRKTADFQKTSKLETTVHRWF